VNLELQSSSEPSRRTLRSELLLVLLLSFLGSAIYAAITFTYDLTHIADPRTAPVIVSYVPPRFDP
jgi:hypothetical protein